MEQDSIHQAATVGELGHPGYRSRSVKQGMGENRIARLKNGDPVFDGIISQDDTLIPQVVNAIFSRHDMLDDPLDSGWRLLER